MELGRTVDILGRVVKADACRDGLCSFGRLCSEEKRDDELDDLADELALAPDSPLGSFSG